MARRIDGGSVLAGLGAVLVLVSLFLDWYEPGLSAWTVFETLDIVLAFIAVATLVLVVPRLLGSTWRAAAPDGALPALCFVAFVIVGLQLLNHPPAAIGRDEAVGAWLALAGATLLLVGATLIRTRITISFSSREAAEEPAEAPAPAATDAEE